MSDEIIKVLDAICEKLGIAVDWTSEKIMPYLEVIAEKVVRLELVEAVMGVIYAFVVLGIAVGLGFFAKFCFKKHKELDDWNDWNIGGVFCCFLTVCFGITFLVVLMTNIGEIVECIVFPEKVVFDFVTGYIESMK